MKKIIKPSFLVEDIFDDCVSSFRDITVKNHYNSIRNNVIVESQQLEIDFISKTTHYVASNLVIGTIPVTKDDMIRLYDEKLVKSTLGRSYYDKIMLLAPDSKCPYCGVRNVRTLDHFMAKSLYPVFSVTPINLSPCCSDCNKDKKSLLYSSFIDTPINPYYDDYNNDEWLYSSFKIKNNRPIFSFFTKMPSTWTLQDIQKIKNHCNLFKLFDLYQIEANSEYAGKLLFLKKYKIQMKPQNLREYFKDMYLSHKNADLNCFQTAMYRSLMIDYMLIYNSL